VARSTTRLVLSLLWRIPMGIVAAGFSYLVYSYLTLPDVRPLRTVNPETTAFMELRRSEAEAQGRTLRRSQQWVSYGRISQDLKRAVLVSEDSAFWQHEGVDMEQLQESIELDLKTGRFVRGGSTITQQLAKNLYLSPSRNPIRKLRELVIARRLESELKKARIFELYLNVIEWGDGVYGVEAASRQYFRESAAALGPSESALLAAAIINPRRYNPAHPNARLLRRQQLILRRMGAVQPPADTALADPPASVPDSGSAVTDAPAQPADTTGSEPSATPASSSESDVERDGEPDQIDSR
jgi:monofunctional biosynthetic peptidoglycan transglycosylase